MTKPNACTQPSAKRAHDKMCLFRPRVDGPPECPMLPVTWRLIKMIWTVEKHAMPKLRTLVAEQREQKRVFHIRTLTELRQLHREVERLAAVAGAELNKIG